MAKLAIVEDEGPFKDRCLSLLAALICVSVDSRGLERAEEALHHGIIVTVAFPAHAHLDVKLCEHSLIGQTGETFCPYRSGVAALHQVFGDSMPSRARLRPDFPRDELPWPNPRSGERTHPAQPPSIPSPEQSRSR